MAAPIPVFLSVVFSIRNQSSKLEQILLKAEETVKNLVSDYELIVIDVASEDDSLSVLKKLTGSGGLANLQVYALTKQVDSDTSFWVGLENALGDFVAVLDPLADDIQFLPTLLEKSMDGADVVFAANDQKPKQTFIFQIFFSIFNFLYSRFKGIHLSKEAPQYRVLSKKVINFILRHPSPSLTYRHLPATGGFSRFTLAYSSKPQMKEKKNLFESIDKGMRLLVSTTRGPMRLVTMLSLFGAVANILYSIYVIVIAFIKTNIAAGWVTLSLQQSGMFFLISLVLLVLGEYILQMASLGNEGPKYHVAQEFNSVKMTRKERLNIEFAQPPVVEKNKNV